MSLPGKFMPHLARYLQNDFRTNCPQGWTCQTEVKVVPPDLERWLGYAPQADAMFQEVATGRRVWVELEISRADPVANHAKFATAHLLHPLPVADTFVSMVSRHVARGRSNLCAHTIGLMRAIGLRAFQTPLFPGLGAEEIKRLNHLQGPLLREEAPEVGPEMQRLMSVATVLGHAFDSDIHFAANAVEVVHNVHRWNKDLSETPQRVLWGKRTVRYFVHDPRTHEFAPSKFAAYLRLPRLAGEDDARGRSLTGMNIASYVQIDQEHPLFDGRRAWQHLTKNLGMDAQPLEEQAPTVIDSFRRWTELHKETVKLNPQGVTILTVPQWAY